MKILDFLTNNIWTVSFTNLVMPLVLSNISILHGIATLCVYRKLMEFIITVFMLFM